ncbi:YceD family protein [Nitrosovibrio sp. Nv4]|uniref:YceD family protein n=1 Tax=Nitrosovibrio sp. Nv4 TaxID=1945880 RepID=UPI000BD49A2A|nr:YceD family protein [Nitrosovibrio sp. Nv4]SOD41229.1 uncharacterized protein SAMN06298226_1523 [Nitrosovibrio sp. Nv4]
MPVRLIIDPLDFARNAGAHHGKIALSELERLQDYLIGNDGELQYAVTGTLNRDARPVLQIVVHGSINLQCQRCLGEFGHALDLQTDLLLAQNENELSRLDEDESVDCILAISDMDVLSLIEDEIILSLPISPRHGENQCSIDKTRSNDAAGEKPLFAALAALKNLH